MEDVASSAGAEGQRFYNGPEPSGPRPGDVWYDTSTIVPGISPGTLRRLSASGQWIAFAPDPVTDDMIEAGLKAMADTRQDSPRAMVKAILAAAHAAR